VPYRIIREMFSAKRALAAGVILLGASCDQPLAVSPTKAVVPGQSVCWRALDAGDAGLDRALRVAIGKRLESAGYALVPTACDLSVSWGYTTKGRDFDMAFRTARLSVRGRGDAMLEHRTFEFGPSDLPIDDPDRLAIVLVNAVNASARVAAVSPVPSAPKPPPPPPPAAHGRLPPEVIQRVVRADFPQIKRCYELALTKDPTAGGRTATKFVIDGTGHVSASADVEQSSTLPQGIRDCVADRFRFLQFPPPEGGDVTVIYPLVFSPGAPAVAAAADGAVFDRSAAATSLDDAARAVQSCAASAGPRGRGHVTVKFAPSGAVSYVRVDTPAFANTPTGACVEARFGQAHVPAFTSGVVTVGKAFELR